MYVVGVEIEGTIRIIPTWLIYNVPSFSADYECHIWWSIYNKENPTHMLISMKFHTTIIGMVHDLKLSGPISYHIVQIDLQCSQIHAI
jgi:hypothetical protein